jgi:hypothetical protein
MIYFKLIFVSFILFTFSTKANDVQIIELHKNKSLDQLVLEKENNENEEDNKNNSINIKEADNKEADNIVEQSNIIEDESNLVNIDDQDTKLENSDEQIVYLENETFLI